VVDEGGEKVIGRGKPEVLATVDSSPEKMFTSTNNHHDSTSSSKQS